MTAVKLKGTFSKTERDSNGLEDISNDLVKNEFTRYLVVGMVEQHKVTKEPGEAPIPTARFVAIEVARGEDEEAARDILDRARKSRGLGNIADTLFSTSRDDFDFDGPQPELDGQAELNFDGGEGGSRRLGPDGEHDVPPPTGEEIMAERAEAKAKGKPATDPFTPDGS